jgi:hypothetical protein
MARTSANQKAIDSLLGNFVERLADGIAARLNQRLPSRGGSAGGAARGGRRGTRKLDMTCRVEGCKNKSRGPRFGFICDEHRKKLSKKDQQAARDAWNARKKAA